MDVLKRIKESALWEYNNSKYHVKTLKSGLHSDSYLNTDFVVSDVPLVEAIVKIFSEKLNSMKIKPDWIITYPPYGLPIAYAFARQVGAKFGYVGTGEDICNFDVKKGDCVIIVGDDVYSGGSLKKTISVMRDIGADVVPLLFTVGNFSGAKDLLGIEIFSILSESGNLYSEEDCPMCRAGSEAVSPRLDWKKLMKREKL